MITFTQLEYIVAVEKYGHFAKAAKACFVTQPTLSMQLKKAEEDLGIVIFDRIHTPATPTDEGRQFIEQAKVVLAERDILLNIGKVYGKDLKGEIKLGIIPTISPYLLPLFLKDFSEKYPQIKLIIVEMKTADIEEQLIEGSLDAGILATPLGNENLMEDVLFTEAFSLYVHPDHFLAKYKKISQEQLTEEGLWLLSDGHCFRDQTLRICHIQKGIHMALANVMFQSSSFETLRSLIQRLKGYTLVPELFVRHLSEEEKQTWIKFFRNPIPVREVSLVYHPKHWKLRFFQVLHALVKSKMDFIDPKRSQQIDIIPIY